MRAAGNISGGIWHKLATGSGAYCDNVNLIITPTNDGAGVGVDLVQVKIKRTLVVGGKLFIRLKATMAP